MRIYLIGYSYSGKTTLGRELAKLLQYSFFDTDKAIELKYHTTVPMFFSRYGEQAFRIIEHQILLSTETLENAVISTGGGTACNDENIKFILEHGIAIHLQMSVDDIMLRIAKSRKTRPLLKEKTTEEQRQFITEQLNKRLDFYSQAPITIPALQTTAKELQDELVKRNLV